MASKNIVSSQFLAKFFRKDIRTIQLWAKHEGMPKEGRDKYDFVKVVDWRIQYLESLLKEAEGTGGVLKTAKERKEAALAERAEYELALLKKELIKVNDIIPFLEKIFTVIVSNLPVKHKKIIPKLLIAKTDKDAEKLLKETENELRNELAAQIENILRSMGKSADESSAADKAVKTRRGRKTKRVGAK